jgi:uncharacterized protein YjiS (DUF1127 family)
MSTHIPQTIAASTLLQIAALLLDGARVLKRTAERLDRFIAIRRKSSDDLRVLAGMSERELRDIGVCDAHRHALRWGYRAGEWRGPI